MGDPDSPLVEVIDALAAAQRYSLDIADPQVRVEAILDRLDRDAVVAAWCCEQAFEEFEAFKELWEAGDFAAACEIAEAELLPTLHAAAAAGNLDRGATPDEIRDRDPDAFRSVEDLELAEDDEDGLVRVPWAGGAIRATPEMAPLMRARAAFNAAPAKDRPAKHATVHAAGRHVHAQRERDRCADLAAPLIGTAGAAVPLAGAPRAALFRSRGAPRSKAQRRSSSRAGDSGGSDSDNDCDCDGEESSSRVGGSP